MITIQHQTTRFTVLEQNAQKYRAILDSGKPVKFRRPRDVSAKRDYPVYTPGMSTSDYLAAYDRINAGHRLLPIQHYCDNWHKPATLLDPTIPEVIGELDPDYTEQEKPKTSRTSAKRYAALRDAVIACLPDLKHYAATHGEGPDARLAVLLEVLEK